MNKLIRKALWFVSTVAFIVVTPLVILYAIGYRSINPALDPQPVGVVLVGTQPVQGAVYMNGEFAGQAPRALTNIANDHVSIAVEAEGYDRWEKTIAVAPGKATELRDIRLFPSVPAQVELQEAETFSLAPNRQLLASAVPGTISVSDVSDDEGLLTIPFVGVPVSMLWSPGSDAILLTDRRQSQWLLQLASGARAVPVPRLSGASDLVWDPRLAGRVLYISTAGDLVRDDLISGQVVTVARGSTIFAVSERDAYIWDHAEPKVISVYSLQGELQEELVLPPEIEPVAMLVTPQGRIALKDATSALWVRDEGKGAQWHLASVNVLKAQWSPDGKMLLLQKDPNTITVINVADERAVLAQDNESVITRLSRPILDVQWFAGGRHIIYQVEDELIISEIDIRDQPITYKVDTTNLGRAAVSVGRDGEEIFYLKRRDERTWLTRAPLLVEEE